MRIGGPNPSISLAGGALGRCRVKKGGEGLLLGGSASFLLPYAEQLPQDGGQEGGGAQDYDLHGLPSFLYAGMDAGTVSICGASRMGKISAKNAAGN